MNCKNNFLLLVEGPTFGINGSFEKAEKKLSINISKAKQNLLSYLFVNGKKVFKFKGDNKNTNFPTQFCLRSKSNGFISATESREVSSNVNVFNFSVN